MMKAKITPRLTAVPAILTVLVLLSCAKEGPVNPWHPDLAGDIAIVLEPDYLDAGWTLSGPNNVSRQGSGGLTLSDMPAGEYSLTWDIMPGWEAPDSALNNLERRGTISFLGSYVLQTSGSARVSVEPASLAAPWTLAGPFGYSESGTGGAVLSGLPLGTYTLTWEVVTGWLAPIPATIVQTLAEGGTLIFEGLYTEQPPGGTVVIDPSPDDLGAPWVLSGPGGYSQAGSGDDQVSGLTEGVYTLTWNTVEGWSVPSPATSSQSLSDGATITFTGTYMQSQQGGTLVINTEPQSITPSWSISGPGGYANSGFGDLTINGLDAGEYVVTWSALDGWSAPATNPVAQTLFDGQTITFTGTYVEAVPTYIGMFVSDNGSNLATVGAWSADNHYTVHVLLVDAPAAGVAGWEAAFTYSGANTVMQGADFLGGSVTGSSTNAIVTYSSPRLPNANGYLHVADLYFYCGTQSYTLVDIETVSFIGYTPSVLYFQSAADPDGDIRLFEYGGSAQFEID